MALPIQAHVCVINVLYLVLRDSDNIRMPIVFRSRRALVDITGH